MSKTTDVVSHVQIADIVSDGNNPRNTDDKAAMKELVASVKEHGIITPLLVRPIGSNGEARYELVAGHRRLRAAREAKLEEVPVYARAMTNEEVAACRMVENLQRKDLHPLEEARGFDDLIQQHHYGIDEIAGSVGKSRTYVLTRLKLMSLIEPARQAFRDGKINLSVAFLIARIGQDVQGPALKAITQYHDPDNQMSASEAKDLIERTFMLDLAKAPFDTKDATLVVAAGSCAICPKRTGNQKELFADVAKGDTCTDPACFQKKSEAAWQKTAKEVADNPDGSVKILDPKEAKTALKYDHSVYGDWVNLAEKCYSVQLPSGSRADYPTWGKLLKGSMPTVHMARRDNGEVLRLVRKSDAIQALKNDKVKLLDLGGNDGGAYSEKAKVAQKKARQEAIISAEVNRAVMVALLAELSKGASLDKGPWAKALPVLASAAVKYAWFDTVREIAKRRELKSPESKAGPVELLKKSLEKMDPHNAALLLVECVMTRASSMEEDFAEALGVDTKGIERAVRADLAAAKKAKPKEKKRGLKTPSA